MTWDQAQETLFRTGRGHRNLAEAQIDKVDAHGMSNEQMFSRGIVTALQHDFALDNEEDFSLPLVVMQFALRRLSRCTEFCLVCHRKLIRGYEAVKPYVCEDQLCIHQYLNLGFGHTVEHEVIKHPYVVDLLISFFAAAIHQNSRTKIPLALGIKTIDRKKRIPDLNDADGKCIRPTSKHDDFGKNFGLGKRFVLVYGASVGTLAQPDWIPASKSN